MRSPLELAGAGVFGAVAAARRARAVHPHGVMHAATLSIDPAAARHHGTAPLFATPRELPALVRASKTIGLPGGTPDWLGLAVRVCDLDGPGLHLDLPMVTSLHGPVLHHLLVPGVLGFDGQPFSSSLLHAVGGREHVIGLLPLGGGGAGADVERWSAAASAGQQRYALALAKPLTGRWTRVAELRVGARVPDEEAEAIRFNPHHTAGGVAPSGPLQGSRRSAYQASQAMRRRLAA